MVRTSPHVVQLLSELCVLILHPWWCVAVEREGSNREL